MFATTEENLTERLEMIDQLKSFLMNAPDHYPPEQETYTHSLANGDTISCIKWNDAYFITGTDIVRSLLFRFLAFGRPVENIKKFEEGIFSDLRNLKPGTDAILEPPKSAFLSLLFKNNCIRTQKKQKVFYWRSVPHDRLFLDALERDLKREKLDIQPTSKSTADPALQITLSQTQAMYDEFRKSILYELNLSPVRQEPSSTSKILGQYSLFDASPTYKQRKRRSTKATAAEKTCTEKYFECPLSTCDKVFKRLEHMKRHLRTHTLERPYLCDTCGKRFSRSDNLAQHRKTHKPKQQHSPDWQEDEEQEEEVHWKEEEEDDGWKTRIGWQPLYNQPPMLTFSLYSPTSPFLLTPAHTTVNSPIMDESPTMSPTDALLQY